MICKFCVFNELKKKKKHLSTCSESKNKCAGRIDNYFYFRINIIELFVLR